MEVLIDPTSIDRFRVYDEEALAWDGFFRTTNDATIAALRWRTWTLQAVVTMIKAEKQNTHGLPDPGDTEKWVLLFIIFVDYVDRRKATNTIHTPIDSLWALGMDRKTIAGKYPPTVQSARSPWPSCGRWG